MKLKINDEKNILFFLISPKIIKNMMKNLEKFNKLVEIMINS